MGAAQVMLASGGGLPMASRCAVLCMAMNCKARPGKLYRGPRPNRQAERKRKQAWSCRCSWDSLADGDKLPVGDKLVLQVPMLEAQPGPTVLPCAAGLDATSNP